MATYYVSHTGSNTSPYDTWAKAATSLQTALTAATSANDVVYIDKNHTGDNALAAQTTYTFNATGIRLICLDPTDDSLAEMGTATWIGTGASSYNLFFVASNRAIYIRGCTFRIQGTGNNNMIFGQTGNGFFVLDTCRLLLDTNSGSGPYIQAGNTSTYTTNRVKAVNCKFRFGGVSGYLRGCWELDGGEIMTGSAAINTLISPINESTMQASPAIISNFDASNAAATMALMRHNYINTLIYYTNCILPASFVAFSGAEPVIKQQGSDVLIYNCAAGDEHYHFAHFSLLGSTVVSTGIYANDGAEYNAAGSKYSWKITTTANASYFFPYVSPWIHKYNETTTAITPYLEILRDGSTVAYQDDEVWAEFSYQGTTGFPLGTFVNDRMALLGTPANQAAGAATWTGGTTPWSGKLAPGAAITPAEIGNLSVRVCVGEPSITVYVDPQIRV